MPVGRARLVRVADPVERDPVAAPDATRASRTTSEDGGSNWNTTPKSMRYLTFGKPRSTVDVAGSGQRAVTTLVRV